MELDACIRGDKVISGNIADSSRLVRPVVADEGCRPKLHSGEVRMKLGNIGYILGLCVILTGCIGGMRPPSGPVEFQQIQEECTARLDADNVLNPLRGKVALPTAANMTPDMLADPEMPTPAELIAARTLSADREDCGQKILSWTTHFAPAQLAASQAEKTRADLVMAKFLSGKLTYGNVNRLWYQAFLESREGFTDAARQEFASAEKAEEKSPSRNPLAARCEWAESTLNCASP